MRSAIWQKVSGWADIAPSGPGAPDHLQVLDGWRGLAILLVLIGHCAQPGSIVWKLGGAGVECFFVLSGRLMAEILIVRRQELRFFMARRASRLLPALAFYVLVISAALSLAALLGGPADFAFSAVAALGFFHNYPPPQPATQPRSSRSGAFAR